MPTPEIQAYRFGHIEIDGESYDQDVIILPGRVIDSWWRRQGHRLDAADLDAVFEAQPEVLVVGQGAHGRMSVPPETRRAIEEAGIEIRVAKTEQAVETYNQLREERSTAAALHLTC